MVLFLNPNMGHSPGSAVLGLPRSDEGLESSQWKGKIPGQHEFLLPHHVLVAAEGGEARNLRITFLHYPENGPYDIVLDSHWNLKGNFHSVRSPLRPANEGGGRPQTPCIRNPVR